MVLQLTDPLEDSVSGENIDTCAGDPTNDSRFDSSQQQNRPQDADVSAVLDAFPETERPAVLDHLQALAAMGPQKRAAILALARA